MNLINIGKALFPVTPLPQAPPVIWKHIPKGCVSIWDEEEHPVYVMGIDYAEGVIRHTCESCAFEVTKSGDPLKPVCHFKGACNGCEHWTPRGTIWTTKEHKV